MVAIHTAQSCDDQKALLTDHVPRLIDVLVHHLARARDFGKHHQFAIENIAQAEEQRHRLLFQGKLTQGHFFQRKILMDQLSFHCHKV